MSGAQEVLHAEVVQIDGGGVANLLAYVNGPVVHIHLALQPIGLQQTLALQHGGYHYYFRIGNSLKVQARVFSPGLNRLTISASTLPSSQ